MEFNRRWLLGCGLFLLVVNGGGFLLVQLFGQ